MSLGAGFRRCFQRRTPTGKADNLVAKGNRSSLHVDDEGVTFISHLDGLTHRFTPRSPSGFSIRSRDIIRVRRADHVGQHPRLSGGSQLPAHRLSAQRARPSTAARARWSPSPSPRRRCSGVRWGAHHETRAGRSAGSESIVDDDGRGFLTVTASAVPLEKQNPAIIVIGAPRNVRRQTAPTYWDQREPDDLFAAIAAGADTFDCVSPSRVASQRCGSTRPRVVQHHRRGAASGLHPRSTTNATAASTCAHWHPCAYIHHPFKAKEILAATLCTIHNERFIIRPSTVSGIRSATATSRRAARRLPWAGTTGQVKAGTHTGDGGPPVAVEWDHHEARRQEGPVGGSGGVGTAVAAVAFSLLVLDHRPRPRPRT